MLPPAPALGSDQLIVVGASAGGVEALPLWSSASLPGFPAPIVIAQHLDPPAPATWATSSLTRPPLPVRTVAEREALAPGTVFVVPSNRHVTITDHHVDVHADATRRPTPSVDLLLAAPPRPSGSV